MEMGIAETDPTLDVEGWDTATKLLILTNILMNEEKTLRIFRWKDNRYHAGADY